MILVWIKHLLMHYLSFCTKRLLILKSPLIVLFVCVNSLTRIN
ncbi:hypothetical protein MTR67_034397 [Solanum verrucosum]|uniref:Uncharacterized protein n=1 Tax=Solanum verrucosum TaxID=315347 RepID=A0AAF0ZJ77_SOLVR|nr:hypothetical protein MTR67_034397 [Solanum verrucosum]